jgi:hypothetical protein
MPSAIDDGGSADLRTAGVGCRLSIVRTCSDCRLTKLISDYTPIKGTPYMHSRCKHCRARRAWEAHHPGRSYAEWLGLSVAPDVMLMARTCRECGVTRPLLEYTPIKACKRGWYGKCRVCRARRARERYWAERERRNGALGTEQGGLESVHL